MTNLDDPEPQDTFIQNTIDQTELLSFIADELVHLNKQLTPIKIMAWVIIIAYAVKVFAAIAKFAALASIMKSIIP